MNAFSAFRRTLQKFQQPRSDTTENASSNIDGALQNMMLYLQQGSLPADLRLVQRAKIKTIGRKRHFEARCNSGLDILVGRSKI